MAEQPRDFQEKFTDFNVKNFHEHDKVAMYVNGAWQVAELAAVPKIVKQDRLEVEVVGAPNPIELGIPPKKIELPTSSTVEIDGRTYSYVVDPAHIELDQDGDVVFNLRDTTGGRAGKERLGVKAEILRNLSEVKGMQQKVSELLTRIKTVQSMERTKLLDGHKNLVKRVEELLIKFGSPSDWEDWEASEIDEVGRKLEETRRQILVETAQLEIKMKEIVEGQVKIDQTNQRAETASACAKDLDLRDQKETQAQEETAKKQHEKDKKDWRKKKKLWEEYKKGGKDPAARDAKWQTNHPGEEAPEEPDDKEPELKEVEKKLLIETGWAFFEDLAINHPIRLEVEKQRKERAHAKDASLNDYPYFVPPPKLNKKQKDANDDFKAHTVEIMRDVIAKWKEKTVEKFDFEKERKLLQDKLLTLIPQVAKYPPAKKFEDKIDTLLTYLSSPTTTKDTSNIRNKFLIIWKTIGDIEVAVYKGEISAKNKPEVAERDVDIPQSLLMQIFASRKDGVQKVMEGLYKNSLTENKVVARGNIRSALKDLFQATPDRAILLELKKYGIKSWDNFQKLLDGDLGNRLAGVLNVLAQENLKKEIARDTYWQREDMGWREKMNENIKRSKFWAIKGQMAARIVLSVAVVGTATAGALALFPAAAAAGTLAAFGVAAGGGVVGGLARGLLNRIGFGNKFMKDRTANKMQELEDKKKAEFTQLSLQRSFQVDPAAGIDMFASQTNAEFSAIMAQCLRESTNVEAQNEEPAEVGQLDANARRMYFDAIKNLEMVGIEVDAEHKKEFALAVFKMQAKTMEIVEKAQKEGKKTGWGALKKFMAELAGPNSDPVLIKLMTGTMKAYSGNVESIGAALTCSAVLGAGMGVAFASGNDWVRAGMGAVGGVLVGYQIAEKTRLVGGQEKGKKELKTDVDEAMRLFGLLKRGSAGLGPVITPEQMAELRDLLIKLKSNLKGGRQFETGKKEVEKDGVKTMVPIIKEEADQWMAVALRENPFLRKQIENFIYEAEKDEALVGLEQREEMNKALNIFAEREKAIAEQCKTNSTETVKTWLKRNGVRAIGVIGGGIVGGLSAYILGQSLQGLKHEIFGHAKSAGAGVAAAAAVEADHPASGAGAGHEVLPPSGGKSADVLPESAPKTDSAPPIEHAPASKVPEILEATIPTPEAQPRVGFDFHNENSKDLVEFGTGHNLTDKEFAYLQRLTDKYPQLNNPESLDKILHSAEFADGKPCAHPEIYKGTINTSIEAAADAKLTTLDGILKGGKGTADGVEFLKQQGFNAHSLDNLGITGLPKVGSPGYEAALEQKLAQVVDAYQHGDKVAGKHLFDAFRHDQNRDMSPYLVDTGKVQVLPVRGVGGHNPRVLGSNEFATGGKRAEILVGQAKGYTPKAMHAIEETPRAGQVRLSPEAEAEKQDLQRQWEAGKKEIFRTNDESRLAQKKLHDLEDKLQEFNDQKTSGAEIANAEAKREELLAEVEKAKSEYKQAHDVWDEAMKKEFAIQQAMDALQQSADAVPELVPVTAKAGLDFSEPKFGSSPPIARAPAGASVVDTGRGVSGGGVGIRQPDVEAAHTPKVETSVATQSQATKPDLNPEQQRVADYLEKTGSRAAGRTVVKDETGTHYQEEKVGAEVNKQSNLDIEGQRNHQVVGFERLERTWSDYFSDVDFDDKSEALRDHIMSVLDTAEKDTQSGILPPMPHSAGAELDGGPELKWIWDQLTPEERFLLQASNFGESFDQAGGTVVLPAGEAGHAFKFIDNQGTTHFEFDPKYEYVNEGGQLMGKNVDTGELVPIDPAHPDAPVKTVAVPAEETPETGSGFVEERGIRFHSGYSSAERAEILESISYKKAGFTEALARLETLRNQYGNRSNWPAFERAYTNIVEQETNGLAQRIDTLDDPNAKPWTKINYGDTSREDSARMYANEIEGRVNQKIKLISVQETHASRSGGGAKVAFDELEEMKDDVEREPETPPAKKTKLSVETSTEAKTPTGYSVSSSGKAEFLRDYSGGKAFTQPFILKDKTWFNVIFDEKGEKIGYVVGDNDAHMGAPKEGWPKGIPDKMEVPVSSEVGVEGLVANPKNKELILWLNKVTSEEGPDISDVQQAEALRLHKAFDRAVDVGDAAKAQKALDGIAKLKAKIEK